MTAGPPVGAVVELSVGAVGHGGFCVARLDGRAVFVRHTLPGERVRARVTEVRSRFLRADAVEVIEPSPDRVSPPCPYAGPGRCGGCDWQHVALPAQRELKAAVVHEQLSRLAGLDVAVRVEPVPGEGDGLGWRTRVAFAVRPDGVVGLRRHRSHDVQPVDRCLIAHPGVEAVGVEHDRWRGVRAVEVAAATSAPALLVVTPHDGRRPVTPELDEQVGVLVRQAGGVTPVSGPTTRTEHAGGRAFRVSAGGFWQVHPGAADLLAATVLDLTRPAAGERALDLYAGAGLFAAVLAEGVGPDGLVWAVESDRVAAADARVNLAGAPQAVVRRRVVDARLAGWTGPADLVVLDPPRSGAGPEVSRAVAALRPRAVAYVACDPAALARDLATFGAAGYRLAGLRAFDLFPMTAHVECVALIEPGP